MRNGSAFLRTEVVACPAPGRERPSYRRHAKGQAVVTVRGTLGRRKDVLLGPFDSPQSHAEYSRVLAARGGRYPVPTAQAVAAQLTVDELILAWWQFAERRYSKEGRELEQFRYSLGPLRELYGPTPAAAFGPKCLRAVRQRTIELDWCRAVINRRLIRVRSIFGWGVVEELLPPSVAHALREVKGLAKGDRQARESGPVRPAFGEEMRKALPFCPRPVAVMLQVQFVAAPRSAEVRIMRTKDLDRSDPQCWLNRPGSDAGPNGRHKNAWRGQQRVVALGPQAIALLTPWLREDDPAAYLFQPRQSVQDFLARARKKARLPKRMGGAASPRRPRAIEDHYTDQTTRGRWRGRARRRASSSTRTR